jgi:hypothetical protein
MASPDSGANPASYPMGTGVISAGVKGWDVKLTAHLHLIPRSRMMELYLYPLICLYGIVLN